MSNLSEVIDSLGEAFTEFKSAQQLRLDEIEKRINRPGYAPSSKSEQPPEAKKAVDAAVRALLSGNQAEADKQFQRAHAEMKAMNVGTDTDGGFTVVPQFSQDMTRIMLETAPFIGLPRTVELTSGDSFEEVLDKDQPDANWVGETATRSDTTTPQVGLFSCPVHEICAMPKASQKLIDTSSFDITAWLQSKVAEKFANKEVDAFLNGDGVAKPRGILSRTTAATSDATRAWGVIEHVVTGANGAFHTTQADPLIDLVSKLKPQYRRGAVWLMNRNVMAQIRKFKTTAGDTIWQPSLVEGQPPQLLGYPIVETENMPDPSTGSLSVAFGNFAKAYTIVRRLGTRFLVDPYTDKPNVRLYAYARTGGDANNTEAYKLLKFST